VARPPKLSEDLTEQVVRLVRTGTTVVAAAQSCGIARSTFYDWMKRGESKLAKDRPHREFREAIDKARAEGEAILVQRIQGAAAKGSWQAAAWLLERRYFDEWGKPERVSESKQQVQAKTKSEDEQVLDELAQRRQRKPRG
jgi:hypothetical protein